MADAYWTRLPFGPAVELLSHDGNGLGALSKPAGILSHPNEGREQARSLLQAHYQLDGEYYEFEAVEGGRNKRRAYLLNRLDSGTSGVILIASTEALARELRAQFKSQKIYKSYRAAVFGIPLPPIQLWKDRLAIEKKDGVVRTRSAGNVPAEAQMRVLAVRRDKRPVSLIALEPRTGRSHQLRVQCATRHFPIIGDATYGDFDANRAFAKESGSKRLFLHSAETRLQYTWAGRTWTFAAKAPLPEEFRLLFGKEAEGKD